MFKYVIIYIVVLLIYIIIQYNLLVKDNNVVKEAFSIMDIYFMKRWNLIPNLIEVVKGYVKHEEVVFSLITSLRMNSYDSLSIDKKININEQLYQELGKMMVCIEKYPEIKANENFLNLSRELIQIEDEITYFYYNRIKRLSLY